MTYVQLLSHLTFPLTATCALCLSFSLLSSCHVNFRTPGSLCTESVGSRTSSLPPGILPPPPTAPATYLDLVDGTNEVENASFQERFPTARTTKTPYIPRFLTAFPFLSPDFALLCGVRGNNRRFYTMSHHSEWFLDHAHSIVITVRLLLLLSQLWLGGECGSEVWVSKR